MQPAVTILLVVGVLASNSNLSSAVSITITFGNAYTSTPALTDASDPSAIDLPTAALSTFSPVDPTSALAIVTNTAQTVQNAATGATSIGSQGNTGAAVAANTT